MELHLCPTSQSGYKGVWNTGKKNLRYEAAAGSHRLGRFETAVDAAVCYAKYTASGAEAASKWVATCEARRAGGRRRPAATPGSQREAAPAAGLVTEAEGLRLHLAAGTATGYAGVWTTGKVARPFEAVAGGKRIGRFASVVDAAVCSYGAARGVQLVTESSESYDLGVLRAALGVGPRCGARVAGGVRRKVGRGAACGLGQEA